MSDIVLLVETAIGVDQIILACVLVIAAGFLVFDHASRNRRATDTRAIPRDRMAA